MNDRARDDETWEADERRKRRSGKSRKSGSGEEAEGLESNGRRRSGEEKSESRKRPSYSSKVVSEEDHYESRKESRARQMKKKQEESALDLLSNWYQDGECGANRHDEGERSERRKSSSKVSDHENSHSRSKGRDERSHDGELEKVYEKDSRHSVRKESILEKGHGSSDQGRHSRKMWDDANSVSKVEEYNYGEKSYQRAGKRSLPGPSEKNEIRNRGIDAGGDKGLIFHEKDERRGENDKNKSKWDVDEQPNVSPADLVFIIYEKPHSTFTRDGNDLVVVKRITLAEALTGYTVNLITLDGRNLTIPIYSVIHPEYEEIVLREGMQISKDPSRVMVMIFMTSENFLVSIIFVNFLVS